MKSTQVLKILTTLLALSLATSFEFDGECEYGSWEWDCTIQDTSIGVTISGRQIPGFAHQGRTLIPYVHLDDIDGYRSMFFFTITSGGFHITASKPGFRIKVTMSLGISGIFTSWGNVDPFRRTVIGRKAAFLTAARALRSATLTQAAKYNVNLTNLNNDRSGYTNEKNRINYLNSQISELTANLARANTEMNNLKLQNQNSITAQNALLENRKTKHTVNEDCLNGSRNIAELIATYERLSSELPESALFQYLDKEGANMCAFMAAVDDICLVLPERIAQLSENKKQVIKHRQVEGFRKFINSKEMYYYKQS